MSRKLVCWNTPLVLVVVVLGTTAGYGGQDGQPRESLNIGDKAPDWGKLPSIDGKSYRMADLDSKLLAVVFACHHCPTVVAYEDRIKQLQTDYKNRGVQVVVLNPNAIYSLQRMKDRAEEKEYNFLYIMDESQESGHKFGARNTPHVFLLDEKRVVRYMGAVDDSQNEANVKQHYVRAALDAVLAGNDPPVTKTNPTGCTVKYGSSAAYRARYQ
jgi:alkyl hydroperoxide reductase subunit AhpC